MRKKIVTALAALGIMSAAFVSTAPQALAATTTYANGSCYYAPYTLYVTLKVVHDGYYRNIGVSGYIIDYYGDKVQAQGPSIFQYEKNIYLRRGAIDWTRFYGPVGMYFSDGLTTDYDFTGRDFINSTEYCDAEMYA